MTAVGPFQLLIVLLIVLILFGAGKLPSVGRQLGSAISEFRNSVKEEDKKGDDSAEKNEADSPQP